ncbi:MAG: hypothetical protein ACI8W7_001864 [Gammaproteobacteria bacterium]
MTATAPARIVRVDINPSVTDLVVDFVPLRKAALAIIVLWLIAGISLSAWSWAWVFLTVGIFQELEPALYFSIVAFTTVGYGDIIIETQWHILVSFSAINGLLVFGLNTAFVVEFTSRLRSIQEQSTVLRNKGGD